VPAGKFVFTRITELVTELLINNNSRLGIHVQYWYAESGDITHITTKTIPTHTNVDYVNIQLYPTEIPELKRIELNIDMNAYFSTRLLLEFLISPYVELYYNFLSFVKQS